MKPLRSLLQPALLALPLLAACSAPKQPHRLSDFLGDTSELRVQHENGGVLFYERPGARWLEYDRVWIEMPLLVPASEEDARLLATPDALELATYFRERLVAAVDGAYPVADGPGPDVLRVRTAITGLVPARTVGTDTREAGQGLTLDAGGAAIEAEMLDSMTGRRLAAFADNQTVRRFGSLNALSTWNDAKDAFDDWAARFRAWLDRTHGRAPLKAERER
jgi:hypothetical protein